MLTHFQWMSLVSVLLIAFAGGYLPLFRPDRARQASGFPLGQAFAAGVFLALSLTIMLPSAFQVLHKAFPNVDYPLASGIAITAFLFLLGLEHLTSRFMAGAQDDTREALSSPVIPIIMTVMIAIPSFFLGTALGISETTAALLIFIAIMAHKGSAGFALALKMVRSTLTRPQTFLIFSLFAFSTPLGIIVGEDVHQYLTGHAMMVVKGVILSLAAGTFLYMGTLHEMRHTSLIENCASRRGFLTMLAGLLLTAFVRLLLGEAHHV